MIFLENLPYSPYSGFLKLLLVRHLVLCIPRMFTLSLSLPIFFPNFGKSLVLCQVSYFQLKLVSFTCSTIMAAFGVLAHIIFKVNSRPRSF